MLRFLTSGESHGPALTAIIDGLPAGLSLDTHQINNQLARRQMGYGRGARQKIENDSAEILSGVRHGTTIGSPIALMITNRDFANWRYVMSIEKVDSQQGDVAAQLEKKVIRRFRPGHADLAGTLKYRHKDIRNVLERASARETAARVAVGAICQQFLAELGIFVTAHVIQVGEVKAKQNLDHFSVADIESKLNGSALFCCDKTLEDEMIQAIKRAWQVGDSLGGVIEVIAEGLPVGLGSYTQWDKRLDGLLAQALMSVQAMKAVEIGDGVENAALPGSQVHDALYPGNGQELPFTRKTNHAGGIEGGMTNGERLKIRAYMKPIPTLRNGLPSVSFPDFQAETAHYERSDVCAISAAAVVCQSMISFVLARAILEKFGSDTMTDIKLSLKEYKRSCNTLDKASVQNANADEADSE